MLHYEAAFTPSELTEKVNAHKGEIIIHSITHLPVVNEAGISEIAFMAFFTVKPVVERVADKANVPLEQRKFIGMKPTPPSE